MQAIDGKTRKLFTVCGGLHLKSDVDRLYVPRKDGGRGLIAIEDCVQLAVTGLEAYVHGSEERLLQAARGDREDGLEAASVLKKSEEREEIARLGGGSFTWPVCQTTKEVRSEQSWVWPQNRDLKRETESLIVAAQNQNIRTNLVKGCVRYIFASLCFKFKGEHLSNKEKYFLFHFKSSFRSWDNQILTFQIFRCYDVIKCPRTKHQIHSTE